MTSHVCHQSCAGCGLGKTRDSKEGPVAGIAAPKAPRYGHSSWGCSSLEAGRGGSKSCCCFCGCCAGLGHPLSPPGCCFASALGAEGEEELPEGHHQQSPALGCHRRRRVLCPGCPQGSPVPVNLQTSPEHAVVTQARSLKSHPSAPEDWEA